MLPSATPMNPFTLFLDTSSYYSLEESDQKDPSSLENCYTLFQRVSSHFFFNEPFAGGAPLDYSESTLLRKIRDINYFLKNRDRIDDLQPSSSLREHKATEEEEALFSEFSRLMHRVHLSFKKNPPSFPKKGFSFKPYQIGKEYPLTPDALKIEQKTLLFGKIKLKIIVETISHLALSSAIFWKNPFHTHLFINLLLLVNNLPLTFLTPFLAFDEHPLDFNVSQIKEGEERFSLIFKSSTAFFTSLTVRERLISSLRATSLSFSFISTPTELSSLLKKYQQVLKSIEKLCKKPIPEEYLDYYAGIFPVATKYRSLIATLRRLNDSDLSYYNRYLLRKDLKEKNYLRDLEQEGGKEESKNDYALSLLNLLYSATQSHLYLYEIELNYRNKDSLPEDLLKESQEHTANLQSSFKNITNYINPISSAGICLWQNNLQWQEELKEPFEKRDFSLLYEKACQIPRNEALIACLLENKDLLKIKIRESSFPLTPSPDTHAVKWDFSSSSSLGGND